MASKLIDPLAITFPPLAAADGKLAYIELVESAIRKGCPFCGAPKNHIALAQKREAGFLRSWVECGFCGSRGAWSHEATGGPAGAVFDWNERAKPGDWTRPCSQKRRDAFISQMRGGGK